jgi:hypothetical protein
MDVRKMRLEDFKSAYATAFTECLLSEARATEAHAKMLELERSLTLLLDASTQELLNNAAQLSTLQKQAREDLRGAIDGVKQAAKVLKSFDDALLGKDGVALRLNVALNASRESQRDSRRDSLAKRESSS